MIGLLLAGVLLAGCATQGEGRTAEEAEVPHGYVEGAEETAEPQLRLVLSDGDARAAVYDVVTGEATEVAAGGVRGIEGDGRYAFVTTAEGALRVIDSGGWTVDHGDHVHYYRAAARDLGTIAGRPPYEVTGDVAITAVRSGDGTVTLFDRARMDRGELAGTGAKLTADAVVPYGERLLVAKDDAVQVRARTGEPGNTVGRCEDPAGTAVTRRGALFGCADGALLVTEKNGAFDGVKIRYPREKAGRAREFRHRPGSATLAAKAGDAGVWVLDVTGRTWRLLRTGPVVAVNATGDDTPVLSLTADGVLHAHDPRTGKRTARTKLLTGPAAGSTSIRVDTARAYVNDPAGEAVHEIDYNDGLRRARTLKPGLTPAHMTETGR
ncbi:lipoprotein [Nonomuraea monospora]|uniref:Lipoprotein n=1 Tax=Nonomuraea monospora TaxID=568818 RepID=A0ABN3CSF1_9ACTN